ncbi:MAG: leucyl aminopeptidase [Candidatus Aenigmatarchaeota archaeon]
MKIELKDKKPEAVSDELLVFPLTEKDTKSVKGSWSVYKLIRSAVIDGDFRGKFKDALYLRDDKNKTKRILLVGLGKDSEINEERIRRCYSIVFAYTKKKKISSFTTVLPKTKLKLANTIKSMIEGVVLSDYDFDKYKKKDKETKKLKEFSILSKQVKDVVRETLIECESTKFARTLVNEPADKMNPLETEKVAKEIAKTHKIKVTIIADKELAKKGMNLIYGVGKGSIYPPRLIIMEYWGGKKSEKPICLVGKGITFDTGGINLKPTGYIEDMKSDKGGACAVISTMKALAELKIKKNVVGLASMCENMIGSGAQRPSDIVKSYSGQTVEILNTDAEGRLAMADALTYAEKHYKPQVIVDLATLTGACVVALGQVTAGMVSTSDKYSDKMYKAGQKVFERVWRLPLYEEYEEMTKGEVSDIKNIGYKHHAGTISAAGFLRKFIKDTPWIHLDIAGVAFLDKPSYYLPKGATGFGVRLLLEFIKSV